VIPRNFKIGDRVSYKTTLLPWVVIGGMVQSVSKDGLTIYVQWDDLLHSRIEAGNFRLSKEAA